jgi:hypothetical protein
MTSAESAGYRKPCATPATTPTTPRKGAAGQPVWATSGARPARMAAAAAWRARAGIRMARRPTVSMSRPVVARTVSAPSE